MALEPIRVLEFADADRADVQRRDQDYLTNANYLGEFAYRLTGRPRTYGISAGIRF